MDDLAVVPESHQSRRDVGRLSTVEGQELLRNIGVSGSDLELNEVVEDWHGHALSLNLIGGYLVNCFDGDVSRVEEIAKPTAGDSVYERVQRILGYYNTNLPLPERTCLILFSAFRAPVGLDALVYICHSDGPVETLTAPLKEFSYSSLEEVLARLVDYRIVQTALTDSLPFLHPLVREYYHELLAKKHPDELSVLHQVIKEFYLSIWESADQSPNIISLRPGIEAVYHACLGGLFDEGCQLYRDSLEHGGEMVLSWKLNAYDTILALMQEFFAEPSSILRGISEETNSNDWIVPSPRVIKPKDQRYILNRTGVAMMNTGRLKAASAYYNRAIDVALKSQDRLGAIHSYQNLSEVSFYRGDVEGSARAAEKALQLSRYISNREEERDSLVYQGWAAHLRGKLELARAAFYEAEELQRKLHPERPFLADLWGIVHADYLLRTRDCDRARMITEANLQYCEAEGLIDNISICHRILGDLDANEGRHHDAGRHYDKAVEIARSIYERTVMLEVLLARGRWAARYGQARMAEADLDEALRYARSGGYRLYLVDTLIGKAWLGLRLGETSLARSDARSAKDQSVELKYYWGELDSTEVLNTIG